MWDPQGGGRREEKSGSWWRPNDFPKTTGTKSASFALLGRRLHPVVTLMRVSHLFITCFMSSLSWQWLQGVDELKIDVRRP